MDTAPFASPPGRFRPAMTRRRVLGGAAAVGAALSVRRLAATAQDATPQPPQQTRDVVYGEAAGTPLLLDVLQPPPRDAARPAVVLLHGGGLVSGSRADVYDPARQLVRAGYVAFSVGYRLLERDGGNAWPAQLDDVQRAVRWVRANAATYGVDPMRIGAYGHSSGGHLAAMLGVRETRDNSDPDLADSSSRVTCVVDLAGEVDLTIPAPSPMRTEIIATLLGGTREEVLEAYRDASPISWVDAESRPFLVIHGAKDFEVPVEHSRRLVEALHEAGVEVAYLELPDAEHSVPAGWLRSGPWVLTFLGVHLHPEQ